jgi:hypothetical protein
MDVVEYVEREQQKLWERVSKKFNTPEGLQKSLNYTKMNTEYVAHLDELITVCAFGYWYYVGQILYNYKEAAPLMDMLVIYDREHPEEENIDFYTTLRCYETSAENMKKLFNANNASEFVPTYDVDSLLSHEFPIVIVDLPNPVHIKKGSPEYDHVLHY